MQIIWKFLQSLSATPTPVYNTVLAINDKITDVFNKIQGYMTQYNVKASLTATYTGGASTIAAQTVLSLSVPASLVAVGDTFYFEALGVLTHPTSAASTVTFWINIGGGTNITVATFSNPVVTTAPFKLRGLLTFRAVGTSGSAAVSGWVNLIASGTTVTAVSSQGATQSQNTIAAPFNVSFGYTFSNSNASNAVTVANGTILMN